MLTNANPAPSEVPPANVPEPAPQTGVAMDVVAQAPRPAPPEDPADSAEAPEQAAPKEASDLPTLPTKEEQAATAKAAQAKIPSNKPAGVGLAIAATTIIILAVLTLAFLAYIKHP